MGKNVIKGGGILNTNLSQNMNYNESASFWGIMQRIMVIPYRRLGKIYRSRFNCQETQEDGWFSRNVGT